ncbi:polyadenylate-binding protein-interacting protein 7-like isoform X2 [Musa acuminata AAA Group]|uniref:polyadenylate-binding protein-interacting protein 7-like isoform X2 n=1 Tax=Musa acuminata AAA Group TaxID=214697 RepID=UPI0031DF5BD1
MPYFLLYMTDMVFFIIELFGMLAVVVMCKHNIFCRIGITSSGNFFFCKIKMNTSNIVSDSKDVKFSSLNKATALNPNAAEFVPSCVKYTYGTTEALITPKLDLPGSSRKSVLDRSESNISNNSDDEVHQYWPHRLPDDITPDFEVMGEDELHKPGHLTLAGLSIHDSVGQSKFSGSMTTSGVLDMWDLSSPTLDNINLSGKMRYPGSIYAKEQPSVASITSADNLWSNPLINGEQQEEHRYNGNHNTSSMGDLIGDNVFLENYVTDPIEFLSSQFPGFGSQSLADVYYGNGCDLNLTIGILAQLELQVDSGFGPNLDSKSSATPNFSPLDFPTLPVGNTQNGLPKPDGEDLQHGFITYRSPGILRGDIDFAPTVRKLALQDPGHWKYDGNGTFDGSTGSSRSSRLSGSSYNGSGRVRYGDKWSGSSAARASPVWLETGEAMANIYTESGEEARDFTRLRNACFEQARQAYLIGNKALEKELSFKGQLYNMHMKAARQKARETIFQKRLAS